MRAVATEIPPEWASALNEQPDNFTLRLVFADWLEEQERFVEAACMRWSVEKKRIPTPDSDSDFSWGYYQKTTSEGVLPTLLFETLWAVNYWVNGVAKNRSASFAFQRLLNSWLLNADSVSEFWRWEPPQ